MSEDNSMGNACSPCCYIKPGQDTKLVLKNNSNFRVKAEFKEYFKPQPGDEECDHDYFDHEDHDGKPYAHHEIVLEPYTGTFDENGDPDEPEELRENDDNIVVLETEENDGIRQGLMSADIVHIFKLAENEEYIDTRPDLNHMEVTAQVGESYEEMNACDFDPECARIVIKNCVDKELDIKFILPDSEEEEHYDTLAPGDHFVSQSYIGNRFLVVHPDKNAEDVHCDVTKDKIFYALGYSDFGLATPEPICKATFINQCSYQVALFWIDEKGNEKNYGYITAGGTLDQETFKGHTWMIRKEDDDKAPDIHATVDDISWSFTVTHQDYGDNANGEKE